jgi:hypothetical protein
MVQVRCVVVMVTLVVGAAGCGPSSSSSFELCGGRFEVPDGFKAVDFGDRYGEKVGRSFSILPTGDQPPPEKLLDVVTPPDGLVIEEKVTGVGTDYVNLGRFTSPDGDCWISIAVARGSLLQHGMPGLDVGWVAIAGEGP